MSTQVKGAGGKGGVHHSMMTGFSAAVTVDVLTVVQQCYVTQIGMEYHESFLKKSK